MKNLQKKLYALTLGIVVASQSLAQSQPPVVITAKGQHYGGRVVYSYEVTNRSGVPLRRFLLGHLLPTNVDGAAQLSVVPRSGSSRSLWLPPETASRPPGWGALLSFPDESATFAIEWIEGNYWAEQRPRAVAGGNLPFQSAGAQPIASGMTSDQFSVTIDSVDPMYVDGVVAVDLGPGHGMVNVPIIKKDQLAPEIRLNVHRLNQNEGNGRYAIFDVRVSATDNIDPAPELTMEAVTADTGLSPDDVVQDKNANNAWNLRLRNVPGRTYTLTFRALDASGNSSVKMYSYKVGG
jgi:hypothetical protein